MIFIESIRNSLDEFMANVPGSQIVGQDLIDPYGGAFKATKGLSTKYGNRILSTPISEAAMVGYGTGRALMGIPTVVEIMFGDFVTLAYDQIINQALKIQEMYGSILSIPLVLRLPMGGYRGYGPTHSQSLESIFLPFPELTVVCPSVFNDPGAILSECIKNKNLTIFVEHKFLYSQSLINETWANIPISREINTTTHYPEQILKVNDDEMHDPDICIISYGYSASLAMEASKNLFINEELHCAVCVVTDLNKFDENFLIGKIGKCKKFIILQEFVEGKGWALEIETKIHRHFKLKNVSDYTIRQIGSKKSTIPSSIELESQCLPSIDLILKIILEIL